MFGIFSEDKEQKHKEKIEEKKIELKEEEIKLKGENLQFEKEQVKQKQSRRILRDWNKKCFEKWKRFELKTNQANFQISIESPKELETYNECEIYLKNNYPYILEKWEQLENAVEDFNTNSVKNQKNVLEEIEKNLKNNFKDFSNEKTQTNNYYLVNEFFSFIHAYQRYGDSVLNEFSCNDQIYYIDFKIINHKWSNDILIQFQKDMNSDEIVKICMEIIKSKNNDNLNFDGKIDEIRENLFDPVIKDITDLSNIII